ncbi:MAG: hypothetical protein RLZZ440_2402, partial [Planctomycetota bacterium]
MTTAAPSSAPAASGFDAAALESLITAGHEPGWVTDRRRHGFERLRGLGLPDRRSETWMRTDIRAFRPAAWGLRDLPASAELPEGLLAEAIESGDGGVECFPEEACQPAGGGRFCGRFGSLDGHVIRAELDPAVAAKGVRFGAAETVLAELPTELEPWWCSVIDGGSDWFAALHAAFHRASAVLYVPPGVKLVDPLHVMAA